MYYIFSKKLKIASEPEGETFQVNKGVSHISVVFIYKDDIRLRAGQGKARQGKARHSYTHSHTVCQRVAVSKVQSLDGDSKANLLYYILYIFVIQVVHNKCSKMKHYVVEVARGCMSDW